MRIYGDCYELMSEIAREVVEMGIRVHPKSMQNKVIGDDPNFSTLEITNYNYCLQSRNKVEALFIGDPRSVAWVKAEFKERINPTLENPGEAWRIRPELWQPFLTEDGTFDYTYSERLNYRDNLDKIVTEIRDNPESRQLILPVFSLNDVQYIGGKKRVPCSVYYQFLIRDGQVNVLYNQRSADVYTHFGNDVWQAWELMRYIATLTKNQEGFLYHTIGSLHVYHKDIENLKTCLKEKL